MSNTWAKRLGLASPAVRFVGLLLVGMWALIGIFPLYWALNTSLKGATSVISTPPDWVPWPITFESWANLFAQPDIWRWLFNSVFVAGAVTAGTILFCGMAGYAFAKGQFAGRKQLFAAAILLMMVSSQVLIVPLFILLRNVGMLDTYWGLILPALAAPFGVFLAKQFMETLPDEVFDAARVDGCSEIGLCFRLAMPMARPVLAIIGVFAFLGNWNEYLFPLIITSSNDMRTLPVGLSLLQNQFSLDYGLVMAAAVFTTIPPLVLFLVMQRSLVAGLTIGAVKG